MEKSQPSEEKYDTRLLAVSNTLLVVTESHMEKGKGKKM